MRPDADGRHIPPTPGGFDSVSFELSPQPRPSTEQSARRGRVCVDYDCNNHDMCIIGDVGCRSTSGVEDSQSTEGDSSGLTNAFTERSRAAAGGKRSPRDGSVDQAKLISLPVER
mmetsp:Transcript_16086/g.46329  ORF Transcript_16086/g.46329 Transcript_16086/m.46329 type:complete len:115 (+) Transcript_16086:4651-4995(+)